MDKLIEPMFAAAVVSGVFVTAFWILVVIALGLSIWALCKPNPTISAVAILLICIALVVLASGGR